MTKRKGIDYGKAATLLARMVVKVIALLFKPTGDKPSSPKAINSKPSAVPVAAFAWPAVGDYDFEVVGESNYQPVLKALRDSVANPDDDATGTAVLVPEDDNPYDNKAIRVTVQGYTAGYLSRDDARSYRRRLAAKKLGMVPASCGFLVTGGYKLKDGSAAQFGMQLNIKPFD